MAIFTNHREGEELDSQGDVSSQPDTISIASRTSQNTLDSDKVSVKIRTGQNETQLCRCHDVVVTQ